MKLTFREQEVIERLVSGEPQKQTAENLGITERTVRFHLQNARRKLNASSTLHLAVLFITLPRQQSFRF